MFSSRSNSPECSFGISAFWIFKLKSLFAINSIGIGGVISFPKKDQERIESVIENETVWILILATLKK